MQSQEEVREYNRIAKQKEREFESYLLKFKAWERFPGESWGDFKKRFKSVRVVINMQELTEDERQNIINKLNKDQ